MRIALFSQIDDWDVGPRLAERGHKVVAWIKPEWTPERRRPAFVRRLARAARMAASQASPPTAVPRVHDPASWIEELGIERISCPNVNDPAFVERLRAMQIDLAVVAAYPQILRSAILGVPRLGVVNYHPSLLPQYAGPQPAFWVLRNGETRTGITTHWMTERIDAGDILAQEVVDVAPGENIGQLMQRLHHRAVSLIVRTVDAIATSTVQPIEQDAKHRTYFGKKPAAASIVDWKQTTTDVINLLRALRPFEPLQTRLDGRTLRIFEARALPGERSGQLGEVLRKVGRRFVVQAADGAVEVTRYEIEPLHGWRNALAQRKVPREGDRLA